MSRSEDYLDDLLNSVSGRNDKNDITDLLDSVREDEERVIREERRRKRKKDYGAKYYREFVKDLESFDDDEFIRNFELELDAEEAGQDISEETLIKEGIMQKDSLDIDGILSEAKKRVEGETDELPSDFFAGADEESPEEDELPEDFELPENIELPEEDELSEEDELPEEDEQIQDESKLDGEFAAGEDSDDGLLDLLSGLSEDSELSDIGALLKAEEDDDVSEMENLESIDELSNLSESKGKKDRKKKNGPLSKFMKLLFGEDEDELAATKVPEEGTLDNISNENMEILKEIDAEKKGKKKKEKKEKAKKEKPKKEKKEKPPKPKKEKKPKAPDLSPPLPKKPVILIGVMAASIFVLIMLGSNLINYSNNISSAKDSYNQGNYVDAYTAISGMSVKDKDQEFYKKCAVLAIVQEQYYAYLSLMDSSQYQLALDSLIRGIGRYDKYYEKAQTYGILPELEQVEQQIEQVLDEQFSVTRDQALALYQLRERDEYSMEIQKILNKLGLG